jgi:hypothetical protein
MVFPDGDTAGDSEDKRFGIEQTNYELTSPDPILHVF